MPDSRLSLLHLSSHGSPNNAIIVIPILDRGKLRLRMMGHLFKVTCQQKQSQGMSTPACDHTPVTEALL